jgi:2-amino-4-hydroxy-6-hydroxymethyldihydropteridine diphosphokinase
MVTLPHPGAHRRAFVLGPLAVIAPAWHHPMLQRTARQLLERLPPGARREVATLRTLGPDDLLK